MWKKLTKALNNISFCYFRVWASAAHFDILGKKDKEMEGKDTRGEGEKI